MYRHFATVTVAITALLAFFANGESHQAVAANAGEQGAMPQPAAPKPRLEIHRETNVGSWADDEGEVMGQPTIGAYSSPAPRPNPFALDGAGVSSGSSAPDGETGGAEQTEQAAAAPTASQIAAATAASRLRSGTRGID
jgi:hypothetical protein